MTNGRQSALAVPIKPFRLSSDKNQQSGAQRSIHFEAVLVAIETGCMLDVLAHPNPEQYPGQRILVVEVAGSSCLRKAAALADLGLELWG